VLPRLYTLYLGFVGATSRVDAEAFGDAVRRLVRRHRGLIVLLWHDEVFTVAWAYGRAARLAPHTLASAGDAGEVVTRILERCGYTVFRGGSTRHRSRRRAAAPLAMVRHMRDRNDVLYGLTVDGSKGPALHMKPGGAWLAARCGRPVALARTSCRRGLRLPTWDGTVVPLPWNDIRLRLRGPFEPPPDGDAEALERFRARLERELLELAAEGCDELGRPRPAALARRLEETHPAQGGRPAAAGRDAIRR